MERLYSDLFSFPWEQHRYIIEYANDSGKALFYVRQTLLERLYPEKVEGTMPSIKEIEAKLDGQTNG